MCDATASRRSKVNSQSRPSYYPRTIILAVVQANNDITNRGIIQESRKVDKAGQRTVEITTKPDLINVGTEKGIALLAKN